MKMELRTVSIREEGGYLDEVQTLWRANRHTLGFFPEAALIDYARRGEILGVLDASGKLVGYLLFYRTQRPGPGVARVIHLCVKRECRDSGVARQLIAALRERTSRCRGASVRCRRDFSANSLWPKLGFQPVRETLGRAKLPITEWWLDYGHPDLMSMASDAELANKLVAVLDACVFFAITDTNEDENVEAQALLADWIPDSVVLCVAPELQNEINRNTDDLVRKRNRELLRSYRELRATPEELEECAAKLRPRFRNEMRVSDESDMRELAYAICGRASVFLTYDPRLLALDDELYREFGLAIQRPATFISTIDEAFREREYQPIRFRGTSMESRRVRGGELDQLAAAFQQSKHGERKATLREQLAELLSNPTEVHLGVMLAEGQPVLLRATRILEGNCLAVGLLRTCDTVLSATLASVLVSEVVKQAVSLNLQLVRVEDPYLSASVREALREAYFWVEKGLWYRAILRGIASIETTGSLLKERAALYPSLQQHHEMLIEKLRSWAETRDCGEAWAVEQAIWPAKLAGTTIPSYIIPIRPHWAAQLFDSRLAAGRLFPSNPMLLLGTENAYYTGSSCASVETPGRVLWYVSYDKQVPGTKGIRCASTLEDVLCGSAKSVYRQFRRMGAYSWRDVSKLTRKDGKVTALHLGRGETLEYPIIWEQIQSTLEEMENRKNALQRPTRIETATYDVLYRRGSEPAQ